jgi:hypothetical protein
MGYQATIVDNFICELRRTQDLLQEKGLNATPSQIVEGVMKIFRPETRESKKIKDKAVISPERERINAEAKQRIKNLNITQREFGRRVGLTESSVCYIHRISNETMKKVLDMLDVVEKEERMGL